MIKIHFSRIESKRVSPETLVDSIIGFMDVNVEITENKEEADVIVVQKMEDIKEELREDKIYLLVNEEVTEWSKEDLPGNVFSGDNEKSLEVFLKEVREISDPKTGGY